MKTPIQASSAEANDEAIISPRGEPAVRVVPVQSSEFHFGALAHLVSAVPDFDEPMNEHELARWEHES